LETKQKTRIGRVISNKMEKTVVITVETTRNHRLYKKTIKRMVKYKVHDAKKECELGDVVRIMEARPFSKEKRWRVAGIITKKEAVATPPEEIT